MWSTERPTKTGWYWFSAQAAIHESIKAEPEIVHVVEHDGMLCVELAEDLHWPVGKYSDEYEWQPVEPAKD